MLFNSHIFLLGFLPVTLLVFFLLTYLHYTKLATAALVVASLVFYAYWDVKYLPLLMASIVFNFYAGRLIEQTRRKIWLVGAVSLDLALLGYFKYTNFFLQSYNQLFGTHVLYPEIILPLGISFFTFTQIAYLVDAYRGETENYSLLTYSLFVTFFPHLIAGPILYHKAVIPQFHRLRHFVFLHKNMAVGLALFSIGLFKKAVLADSLAEWVRPVFERPADVAFIEAWVGALSYTLQLYFDFSGYSDMAIGLGKMLNINLPLNFASPYQALSIIDFWKRWHITLSAFLKQYLYIPLGGNRLGGLRQYSNILLTMLLGGLWHGAGWTYVIWGGLHGVYIVINHVWRKVGFCLPNILSWLFTFIAVVIAWVFFRAQSVADAYALLKTMFALKSVVLPWAMPTLFQGIGWQQYFNPALQTVGGKYAVPILAAITLLLTVAPNSQMLVARFRPDWKWFVAVSAAAVAGLLCIGRVSEFLYFQF